MPASGLYAAVPDSGAGPSDVSDDDMPRARVGVGGGATDAAPLLGGDADTVPSAPDEPRGMDARMGPGAGMDRRRSSLAHALARQNSAQRVQHAGRVANHPLAPPRASFGKTLCSTLFAMVLIGCIFAAFIEDGYDLERIAEPCRSELEPIGLWLKVLLIFPCIDIVRSQAIYQLLGIPRPCADRLL